MPCYSRLLPPRPHKSRQTQRTPLISRDPGAISNIVLFIAFPLPPRPFRDPPAIDTRRVFEVQPSLSVEVFLTHTKTRFNLSTKKSPTDNDMGCSSMAPNVLSSRTNQFTKDLERLATGPQPTPHSLLAVEAILADPVCPARSITFSTYPGQYYPLWSIRCIFLLHRITEAVNDWTDARDLLVACTLSESGVIRLLAREALDIYRVVPWNMTYILDPPSTGTNSGVAIRSSKLPSLFHSVISEDFANAFAQSISRAAPGVLIVDTSLMSDIKFRLRDKLPFLDDISTALASGRAIGVYILVCQSGWWSLHHYNMTQNTYWELCSPFTESDNATRLTISSWFNSSIRSEAFFEHNPCPHETPALDWISGENKNYSAEIVLSSLATCILGIPPWEGDPSRCSLVLRISTFLKLTEQFQTTVCHYF